MYNTRMMIFGTRFVCGLSRADYIMNPNRLSALTTTKRRGSESCNIVHRLLLLVVLSEQRPTRGTIATLR